MPRGLQHPTIISCVLLLSCTAPSLAQTENECLQSFKVKAGANVTYFAESANGQFKVPFNTMSCTDAERFRETVYVSMDKSLYDSEQVLRGKLTASNNALTKLEQDLSAATDSSQAKALILGTAATVATVWAISTTATCFSAVVNGVGLAACGPAARAAAGSATAWLAFQAFSGSFASLKAAALADINKQQAVIATISQELNAAKAQGMKDNYSQLFVGICRAVRNQCL